MLCTMVINTCYIYLFTQLIMLFSLGMFDAYVKIFRYEGFTGLYKGFWVSSVQIVSGKLLIYRVKTN